MPRVPARALALGLALAAALGGVGSGLLRAATAEPPSAPPPVRTAAGGSCAGVPVAAPRQLRGMWLTTVNNIDFPSRPGLSEARVKAEYRAWLDLAVAQRHNAVFVHVRPSGDAFWPSAYAPWSQWLTGRRDGRGPGWDPMAFMVAEAHARNLQFHAWFNPYRGSQPAPAGTGADLAKLPATHPLRKHPDWALAYPTGPTGRLYFDPGNPDARRFVEDSMLEAVGKYDVDGVHFDDFFYPYPERGQDFPDDASYERRARPGQSRADWRRENVDTLVREMSERIRALKPWVQFGISPFGIWRNAATDRAGSDTRGLQSYDEIYADTRRWVRERWLDYVVPQLYWAIGFDRADYAKVLPWWAKLVEGTGVRLYIGIADYRVGEKGPWRDPAQLDRQLTLAARHRVDGSVHFSAKQVRANRLGAVTRYRDHHFAAPALPPVASRLAAAGPAAPQLSAARPAGSGAVRLDWRPGTGASPAAWALYRVTGGRAVLAATGSPGVPVTDPAPPPAPVTYCLTALDRAGNEGPPSNPAGI
ncbi:glycoside hydrolase family 10 protein [Krasilnikovia cinnamomea]|uniref:glycoside hydrolase family 10 protein n=1 Tax=Krasilnikovia cinnamomea TaxID=349313 RepID=UPI001F5F9487|nr:family 10 glycosylhydrolase [Krasilnikovia cinnamomea]